MINSLFMFSSIAFAQTQGSQSAMNWVDRVARTPLSHIVIFVLVCTAVRLSIVPLMLRTPQHKRFGLYTGAKLVNEMADALIYASVLVFLVIRPFAVQTFRIPSGSMVQTLQVRDFIVANKWVYRFSDPQFQDIAVFKPPAIALRPDQPAEDTDFIKRVIGLPGDTIEIRDKVLYRNGKPINEPYRAFTVPDFTFGNNGADGPSRFLSLREDQLDNEPSVDFKLVNYNGKIWPVTIEGQYVNQRAVSEFVPPDEETRRALLEAPPAAIPEGKYLMIGDNRNGSLDSRYWGLVDRSRMIGKAEFIWLPLNRIGRVR